MLTPPLKTVTPADWSQAIATHLAAEKALNEHPANRALPGEPGYEDLEREQLECIEASSRALGAIFDMAAPNAAAFVEKAEAYARCRDTDREYHSLISDARRLINTEQPSLMRALHSRYESTLQEFNATDVAETEARRSGNDTAAALTLGAQLSSRESDALRTAILYQVPIDQIDAMILQFHITSAFDMQADSDGCPDHERTALQVGIQSLLDFMACEYTGDHGNIGSAFQGMATDMYYRRRYRTGMVEA